MSTNNKGYGIAKRYGVCHCDSFAGGSLTLSSTPLATEWVYVLKMTNKKSASVIKQNHKFKHIKLSK